METQTQTATKTKGKAKVKVKKKAKAKSHPPTWLNHSRKQIKALNNICEILQPFSDDEKGRLIGFIQMAYCDHVH